MNVFVMLKQSAELMDLWLQSFGFDECCSNLSELGTKTSELISLESETQENTILPIDLTAKGAISN